MNLKKGLNLVAWGFFFTLVNFNLTLNGVTLNVTPDFIGWILLFLAHDRLGRYLEGKIYLKWLALLLAFMTCGTWVMELAKPELDMGAATTFVTVLSAFYMFVLLGALAKLAGDFGSRLEGTITALRFLDPLLCLGFVAAAIAGSAAGSEGVIGLAAVLGIAALAAAIATMIVLFKLRGEIRREAEDAGADTEPD